MSEFDLQFTLLRNGVEIGFGGFLGNTVNAALYGVESIIQNRQWETGPGQPDPSEVDA